MDLVLSREQVRLIDRLAVERFGIPSLVLMENAGRSAAAIVDHIHGPQGAAAIVCGPGNNGGDGCVIARHLQNLGWTIRLLMTGKDEAMTSDTETYFRIVRAMRVPCSQETELRHQLEWLRSIGKSGVLIDALLGTGFQGRVRSPTAELILAMNETPRLGLVAVDVPSGLDCDTGEPSNATVRADHTVTFVAMKRGFQVSTANPYVGTVIVADIGVPRDLIFDVATRRYGT